MPHPVRDIIKELAFYSLFDVAEKVRWRVSDIPWEQLDRSAVDDELIALVRGLTYGEFTTYSATRAFMDLFRDDIDFTQWLSVWLYEENKHPHVLAKWLSMVGEELSGDFLLGGREIAPMTGSKVEMLTFNIISEVMAGTNYLRDARVVKEPVLKIILQNIGKDEMRHSQGFEHYCRAYVESAEDPDRERLRCLRTAWAFLHNHQAVSHPVFLTTNSLTPPVSAELAEHTQKQVCNQVTRRISAVVGVPIPDPESIWGIYDSLKEDYRQKRRSRVPEPTGQVEGQS